ncbi:xylose isomerase [Verrucomicrobiota bacterium]|nr:xylose isomerase [Verrucomicrobiota bacterium]
MAAAGLGILAPAALRAVEPLQRAGSPRLLLSLAAYSFRQFFKDGNKAVPPADKALDMFKFIDFCADHGCAGAELTSYYFPKELTPEYLVQVRRHAFLRGVAISGTAVGNNFALPAGEALSKQIADVKRWVDHAAILGAPHIRVFAGAAKGITDAEARKMCITSLEEVSDYAGKKGIFLGLENHGGIVAEADGLLEILRTVKSPWLGVNLDTGNFHTDDPYGDLAKCASYAVNVQVKVEIKKRGQTVAEPSDYGRLVKILKDANYQGYVALEYEAAENPFAAVPPVLKKLKELFAA